MLQFEEGDKLEVEDGLGDRYWGEVYGQCVCPLQDTPGHPLLTHLPRPPHTLPTPSPLQELTLRRGTAGVWGQKKEDWSVVYGQCVLCSTDTPGHHLLTLTLRGKVATGRISSIHQSF